MHVIHKYCRLVLFCFLKKLSLRKRSAFGIEKQTALKLLLFMRPFYDWWKLLLIWFLGIVYGKKHKCTVKGSTFSEVYSNRIQKLFLQHFKWENIDKYCSKEIKLSLLFKTSAQKSKPSCAKCQLRLKMLLCCSLFPSPSELSDQCLRNREFILHAIVISGIIATEKVHSCFPSSDASSETTDTSIAIFI